MEDFTTITRAHGKIDYGMTNDYMFRALLQKSRKTLIGLVSAMLHLAPEDIKKIEITNPICIGEGIEGKTFVLDVNIILNSSVQLDLEMQVEDLHNWPERSLCYLCRSFDQLNRGEPYDKVKPTINMGFLKYTLFEDEPEFYAKYSLLNEKSYRKYSDKITVCVVDLTRTDLATEEDKAYGIDTWAKVFLATTWEELRMATESNDYMKDAAQTLYELNADENVRQQCEARRRAIIEEKYRLEQIEQLTSENERMLIEKKYRLEQIEQLTSENERMLIEEKYRLEQIEQLTGENERMLIEEKYRLEQIEQLTSENEQLTSENEQLTGEFEKVLSENAILQSEIEQLKQQLAKKQTE